jgi:hypothetical protein
MSQAVAIGLHFEKERKSVEAALAAAGFLTRADLQQGKSDGTAEVSAAAQQIAPDLDWFIAAKDGKADLDLIYDFSEWCDPGRLHGLAAAFERASVKRVGVLIYDLAEPAIRRFPPSLLREMNRTLSAQYRYGGPAQSVLHEFTQ